MTTLPTTLLIIGSIIFFVLGGFVGVIVMAVISVGRESAEEADQIDDETGGIKDD